VDKLTVLNFYLFTCDYNNNIMWMKRSKAKQISIRLRQLEIRLQNLIEGSAARFFPSMDGKQDLAARLVDAMRQGIRTGPNGEAIGPNLFILETHPSQTDSLAGDAVLLDGLTRVLQEEGIEAGLSFTSPLAVRVASAPDVSPGYIRLQAIHSQIGLTDTTAVEANPDDDSLPAGAPANAFLIVDGMQVFLIRQAVINIGRRADNHLVIDDARVSRVHAQLRAVHSQFIIFDLDSLGGTWVNGERIRQKALQPGDVISLSGVPLVFGQETAYPDATQEMPASI